MPATPPRPMLETMANLAETHHEHENIYAHRWVEIDDRMHVVSYSRPFVFDHRGIEYAAGLCSLNDECLLVTYGWEDREARWVELGWRAVLQQLSPT